jgi:hypothetical protein
MSTPQDQVFGQQSPATTEHEYNILSFVFGLMLQKIQTCTLVKVVSCTNTGGVSPVGTVVVQPLVNQMTASRKGIPHGQLYSCLYSRISGGTNAVIMDPKAGDIGLMGFCSRDISNVVATAGQANPASYRMFDWADGIYVLGIPLGVTPAQYVQFSEDGISLVSPNAITLQAPTITIDCTDLTIDATTSVEVTAPTITLNGAVTVGGTLNQTGGGAVAFSGSMDAAGEVTGNGVALSTHKHSPGTYVVGSSPVTGTSGTP